VGEVLRRVETGETLAVTVAGREVAELRPARRRTWVSGPALARVWHGPSPQGMENDLAKLGASVTDPYSS